MKGKKSAAVLNMLKTVMRLFHPLVSLTLGSGITAKAILPRERRSCTSPPNFFVREKNILPGLWPYVRIVNRTTARSLQAQIRSLEHNSLFFLVSHLFEYGQKMQDLKPGETVLREHNRGNKSPVTEGTKQ